MSLEKRIDRRVFPTLGPKGATVVSWDWQERNDERIILHIIEFNSPPNGYSNKYVEIFNEIKEASLTECMTSPSEYIRGCRKFYERIKKDSI